MNNKAFYKRKISLNYLCVLTRLLNYKPVCAMRRIPYYSRTSKMPVAEFYPVKIRARKIIGIRQNPGSSADETVAAAAAQDCERRRRKKTVRRQFSWNNSSMVRLPIRFY